MSNIKDEVSDLLPLYELANPTIDDVVRIVQKHFEQFDRVGFGERTVAEFSEDFYHYLTNLAAANKAAQYQFIKSFLENDWDDLCQKSFAVSKKVLPEFTYKDPTVVFVLNGPSTDAKVMSETEFGINLNILYQRSSWELAKGQAQVEGAVHIVASNIAHEANHLFFKQLEVDMASRLPLLQSAFVEGLATFVENHHHPMHEAYIKEKDLWLRVLSAIKDKPSEPNLQALKPLLTSEALKRFNEKEYQRLAEAESITHEEDWFSLLRGLYVKANGPIYHLGYLTWQAVFAEGGYERVREVVAGGAKEYEKYFVKLLP